MSPLLLPLQHAVAGFMGVTPLYQHHYSLQVLQQICGTFRAAQEKAYWKIGCILVDRYEVHSARWLSTPHPPRPPRRSDSSRISPRCGDSSSRAFDEDVGPPGTLAAAGVDASQSVPAPPPHEALQALLKDILSLYKVLHRLLPPETVTSIFAAAFQEIGMRFDRRLVAAAPAAAAAAADQDDSSNDRCCWQVDNSASALPAAAGASASSSSSFLFASHKGRGAAAGAGARAAADSTRGSSSNGRLLLLRSSSKRWGSSRRTAAGDEDKESSAVHSSSTSSSSNSSSSERGTGSVSQLLPGKDQQGADADVSLQSAGEKQPQGPADGLSVEDEKDLSSSGRSTSSNRRKLDLLLRVPAEWQPEKMQTSYDVRDVVQAKINEHVFLSSAASLVLPQAPALQQQQQKQTKAQERVRAVGVDKQQQQYPPVVVVDSGQQPQQQTGGASSAAAAAAGEAAARGRGEAAASEEVVYCVREGETVGDRYAVDCMYLHECAQQLEGLRLPLLLLVKVLLQACTTCWTLSSDIVDLIERRLPSEELR